MLHSGITLRAMLCGSGLFLLDLDLSIIPPTLWTLLCARFARRMNRSSRMLYTSQQNSDFGIAKGAVLRSLLLPLLDLRFAIAPSTIGTLFAARWIWRANRSSGYLYRWLTQHSFPFRSPLHNSTLIRPPTSSSAPTPHPAFLFGFVGMQR